MCVRKPMTRPFDYPSFVIRPASPADIPALRRLRAKLLAQEDSGHIDDATEADWLRDGFGPSPHFLAFIAEQNGIAIGIAIYCVRRFPGWAGNSLFLHDLFVEPEFRCRGIGRALMARVAAEGVARGTAFIELDVHEKNPARAMYRKLGFERVAHCATYVAPMQTLRALVKSTEPV